MADGAFQLSEDQRGRDEKGGLALGRKQLEGGGGNANPFAVWGGEQADLEEGDYGCPSVLSWFQAFVSETERTHVKGF